MLPPLLDKLLSWKVGFHQCEAGNCSSLVIVKSGYLKIKNAKNCSGPVLLFLGNLKSCLGPPGLRKPKRGDGGGYGMCD